MVMLAATFLVLVAWLAFVWIFDPDGFRGANRPPLGRADCSPRQ
jgi:hypothetical protein